MDSHSLSLSVSLWRKHLLWHFAHKLDSLSEHIFFTSALAFCSEIGLSHISLPQRTHLVWLFAQKLGFLSQRTHLHIILAILHRNWALSLREHIFFTPSLAILHRIQISNTDIFHIFSFLLQQVKQNLQVQ
jgi:hypothetical protein